MGKYLVGSHHLKIVVDTFSKDQHGIRQRDLDHKDRQNFDAVTHITNPSVIALLEQIPDAKGTHQYLGILKNFIDAFLDEQLSPLQRIKKVWYTIFSFAIDIIGYPFRTTIPLKITSSPVMHILELN